MADLLTSNGHTAATVVVSRVVKPGYEQEYHNWVFRVLKAAENYPNNLGAVILSSGEGQSYVYHLVHRFADEASLHAWEDSETRQRLSREADAFSTVLQKQTTGMETWFALPEAPELPPPAKWKMAVTTFVVAYMLTSMIVPLERVTIPDWPFLLGNLVTNVLLT